MEFLEAHGAPGFPIDIMAGVLGGAGIAVAGQVLGIFGNSGQANGEMVVPGSSPQDEAPARPNDDRVSAAGLNHWLEPGNSPDGVTGFAGEGDDTPWFESANDPGDTKASGAAELVSRRATRERWRRAHGAPTGLWRISAADVGFWTARSLDVRPGTSRGEWAAERIQFRGIFCGRFEPRFTRSTVSLDARPRVRRFGSAPCMPTVTSASTAGVPAPGAPPALAASASSSQAPPASTPAKNVGAGQSPVASGQAAGTAAGQAPPANASSPQQTLDQVPMSFEVNEGQAAPTVQFLAHADGYNLFLSGASATLVLSQPQAATDAGGADLSLDSGLPPGVSAPDLIAPTTTTLGMEFVGADPAVQAQGVDLLRGTVNYLIGNNPSQWHTNISTYAKVEYANLYKGIDLVYYGNQGQLEYDWQVAPGANPSLIQLAFQGADQVTTDGSGNLLITQGAATVTIDAPVLYQEIDGARQPVSGHYVVEGNNQVGLALGGYDTTQPLVIDPVLSYSTYDGANDLGFSIAADSTGSAYVTGYTASGGSYDAFVTKLNPAGTAAVYTTYIGGSSVNLGTGIAVDASGSAYVTGYTSSTNFPTTPGAYQTSSQGGVDAFVTKLTPAGTGMAYSSYLGGNSSDEGLGIALDSSGDAYVTGFSTSTNFPQVNGLQATANGSPKAFATELNVAGSSLVYSTLLGGSDTGDGTSIAVDAAGNAYVAGINTTSGTHAFVTKLSFASGTLTQDYATSLAGSDTDVAEGIAVDSCRPGLRDRRHHVRRLPDRQRGPAHVYRRRRRVYARLRDPAHGHGEHWLLDVP